MSERSPNLISAVAPTLAELKKLPIQDQGVLLLKRLAFHFPREPFSPWNLSRQDYNTNDPGCLATGFPETEIAETVLYLLDAPLRSIQKEGYIAERLSRDGFFDITTDGWAEVNRDVTIFVPNREVLAALRFLHPDLRGYEHYFREQKFKEAIAAAFKRVENRFNELRDASPSPVVKSSSGATLPHDLYKSGDLKFPFPLLAAGNPKSRAGYEQQLRSFLGAGVGLFRNALAHEPHNLPDYDEVETLEQLSVASHMLRIIDQSV
ncbi:hypothetical protein HNQ77_002261 [Silvibacterium bohemicum]|uniref:Conserved hypothetical protein CHP02391 domain-containing protein n=1 Tax=Silvibacterium bohemicum TaxID=1577686 RepID=A0A841JX51_9BACT|nr:TIGR02391 family protein [Silvibacterium bohemicum]MBB6144309.1 hypothetical protein [Silvibacterium bohemicum]